jgi:ribosomal protein S18 acetylase RimI-like enzyme
LTAAHYQQLSAWPIDDEFRRFVSHDWGWLSPAVPGHDFSTESLLGFVAVNGCGDVLAVARVDLIERPGDTVVAVHPRYRRRGLATALLREACRSPRLDSLSALQARVDPDNARSRSCLRRAGFALVGSETSNGAVKQEIWTLPLPR